MDTAPSLQLGYQELSNTFKTILDGHYESLKNKQGTSEDLMDDAAPLSPFEYSKIESLLDSVTEPVTFNKITPIPSSCLHFNPFLKVSFNLAEATALQTYYNSFEEPELSFPLPPVAQPIQPKVDAKKTLNLSNPHLEALKKTVDEPIAGEIQNTLTPAKKMSATAQFLLRSIESTPFSSPKNKEIPVVQNTPKHTFIAPQEKNSAIESSTLSKSDTPSDRSRSPKTSYSLPLNNDVAPIDSVRHEETPLKNTFISHQKVPEVTAMSSLFQRDSSSQSNSVEKSKYDFSDFPVSEFKGVRYDKDSLPKYNFD